MHLYFEVNNVNQVGEIILNKCSLYNWDLFCYFSDFYVNFIQLNTVLNAAFICFHIILAKKTNFNKDYCSLINYSLKIHCISNK